MQIPGVKKAKRITGTLMDVLAEHGIRAAAAPATHNYDPASLAAHDRGDAAAGFAKE